MAVKRESERDAYQRIEQALAGAASFEFVETPLVDVVRYIEQEHQIPTLIDKRALDDVGLGSDTPVTISVENISLRSALRLMLKELDLTYVLRDEVLKITTPEESENEPAIMVYPVADFLTRESPGAEPAVAEEQLDLLIDLIETTVAPDTWDTVGGAGTIVALDPWGLLVIAQSNEIHDRIGGLLSAARRARVPGPIPPADTGLSMVGEAGTVAAAGPFPAIGVAQTPPQPLLGGGGGGPLAQGMFGSPMSLAVDSTVLKVYTVDPACSIDELSQAITGAIAPGSWAPIPGKGMVFPIGSKLLVRQTPAVHAQISELLRTLKVLNQPWGAEGYPGGMGGGGMGGGGMRGGGMGGGGMGGGGMGGGFFGIESAPAR